MAVRVDAVPHPTNLTTPLPAICEWPYGRPPPSPVGLRPPFDPLGQGHRSQLSVRSNPGSGTRLRFRPMRRKRILPRRSPLGEAASSERRIMAPPRQASCSLPSLRLMIASISTKIFIWRELYTERVPLPRRLRGTSNNRFRCRLKSGSARRVSCGEGCTPVRRETCANVIGNPRGIVLFP